MPDNFLNLLKPNTALSSVDLEKLDEEFLDFDISKREQVWSEMNNYFSRSSLKEDRIFWYSYWRWFTDLSWKFFLVREPEFVFEMAVKRQVPMAILLDFDVWRELMKYFAMRTVGEEDAQNLYFKIKSAFQESEAVVGMWKGKEITVAEIVKEYSFIKQRGGDALEMAEFNSKLKQILFPKNDPLVEKYAWVDPDTAIYRFTQLILFFHLMEPKDIWYAVDAFMHPEKVAGEETVATPPVTAIPSVVEGPKAPPAQPAPVAPQPEVKKPIFIVKEVKPGDKPKVISNIPARTRQAGGQYPISAPTPAPVSKPPVVETKKEVTPVPVPAPVIPSPVEKIVPISKIADPARRGTASPLGKFEAPRNDKVKSTSNEIKKMVEARFPAKGGSASGGTKGADGQIEDVEGALKYLGDLAEENKDPKIAELYYFDESSGEFKWKV